MYIEISVSVHLVKISSKSCKISMKKCKDYSSTCSKSVPKESERDVSLSHVILQSLDEHEM